MKDYSTRDYVLISMIAALSIVTKPLIKTLSFSLTSMYGLPGGIIGGIFYMMWLSLVYRVTGKRYSVILLSILQGFLAMAILGIDITKALIFIPSGLAADFVFMTFRGNKTLVNMLAGGCANIVGTICMYFLLFNAGQGVLTIGILIAGISGALSGLVTSILVTRFKSFGLAK
ncbi:hypothetical protein EZV73_01050 [Acidaminobacter sp. JC074]|uniref:hypothetical protein n=1 Tax=Acidaminobacter sp. JC074 TaxID=2530199 RepID=UPI001F0DFE9F|nr:hypothetical protein [Acidaminobacter sp. JC074]MCH4886129.1 hypothetical protein [Acidaminobacter sp. JC074]